MKRKVIQLAGRTLVVSLPHKWADRQGIHKGEELEVKENGRLLAISSVSSPEPLRISLDLAGLDERSVRWMLAASHKLGYDEIEIHYDRPQILTLVNESVKNLFIGFIIAEQGNRRCLVKGVSKDSPEEFDVAFRRNFLLTLQLADGFAEIVGSNKLERLGELLVLEQANNQLSNFCERVLNKFDLMAPARAHLLYHISSNLERVCDDYKYMCNEICGKKMPKDFAVLSKSVAELIREYYNLFYAFKPGKLVEIADKREKLLAECRRGLLGGHTQCLLLSYTSSIIIRICELSVTFAGLWLISGSSCGPGNPNQVNQ